MDTKMIWRNLEEAVAGMEIPEGDLNLKIQTVMAGVELLFECPSEEILLAAQNSNISTRALVSWLVYEGERLQGVPNDAVEKLRLLYEAGCPAGEGLLAGPPTPSRSH